jgi:hypothetical protein
MKLPITIEFNDGTKETFTAQPPEFVKWEAKTGFTIQQAGEKMGISDFLFLAYNSMKRNSGGKAVKPLEAWTETVTDVTVEEILPKATSEEV